jgi:hypothetical protein
MLQVLLNADAVLPVFGEDLSAAASEPMVHRAISLVVRRGIRTRPTRHATLRSSCCIVTLTFKSITASTASNEPV